MQSSNAVVWILLGYAVWQSLAKVGCSAFLTDFRRLDAINQHFENQRTIMSERSREDTSGDDNVASSKPLPRLPPVGESSFGSIPQADNSFTPVSSPTDTGSDESNKLFVGSPKFELQYTCKVCETRNRHKVSRKAYRRGVVICICKGCGARHMIADNLGWSKHIGGFENGESNIEEYFAREGSENEKVERVGKDVWELESLVDITDEGQQNSDTSIPSME